MSTDYVFDGTKDGVYTEEDKVNPKSVYGETKYLGEEEVRRNPNHFITRISWVFGINGNNFINTMIKLSNNKEELSVVNDQVGSPTYTVDLAKLLVEMSFTDKYGTYNVNNEGYCSWAEFAEYIMKTTGKKMQINPVTTEEYLKITAAKQAYRPRNSKLDKSKLEEAGFKRLPTWQDATDRYVEELNDTNKMFLLEHPVKIKK
jgi:dTDP-4-dehydrorhamnose reductase